ncbi:MAG: TIM barrel protein [Candidatus Micrarchaeia archaeon]
MFGTAGTPVCCKGQGSKKGIEKVRELGLDAFEFEFVQSANMKEENARECGRAAKENNVRLSAHAPYYVNLISDEKEKRKASIQRILATAKILNWAGGTEVVFHPGFLGKFDKKKAFNEMENAFGVILDKMNEEKLSVVLSPETTGKHSAWGSFEETVEISKKMGFDKVRPTIDWGHLHARTNGGLKTREDFGDKLDYLKNQLGQKALNNLHCHLTGIRFSEKGEINHLKISSKSPDYTQFWPELIKRKCSGTFISESPNIEVDALKMKKEYEKTQKT